MITIIRVGAGSNPNSVAGSIAGQVREHGRADVVAVGAGAVNQAVKAIAISRGFLAPQGADIICVPAFHKMEIDGESRTGMRFIVEPR